MRSVENVLLQHWWMQGEDLLRSVGHPSLTVIRCIKCWRQEVVPLQLPVVCMYYVFRHCNIFIVYDSIISLLNFCMHIFLFILSFLNCKSNDNRMVCFSGRSLELAEPSASEWPSTVQLHWQTVFLWCVVNPPLRNCSWKELSVRESSRTTVFNSYWQKANSWLPGCWYRSKMEWFSKWYWRCGFYICDLGILVLITIISLHV